MSRRKRKLQYSSPDLLKAIHWTSILKASRMEIGERVKYVIAQLATYSLAPYAVIRSTGRDHEEAAALTVRFMNRVIGGRYNDLAVLEDGKLRIFLHSAICKFIEELDSNVLEEQEDGTRVAVPESYYSSNYDPEPANEFDRKTLFDHWWGRTLNHVIEKKLENDYEASRRSDYYEELVKFSPGKGAAPSYDDVAEKLGVSVFIVKEEVTMFKRLYREIQRVQIASLLSNVAQAKDELHYLVELQRGYEMAR